MYGEHVGCTMNIFETHNRHDVLKGYEGLVLIHAMWDYSSLWLYNKNGAVKLIGFRMTCARYGEPGMIYAWTAERPYLHQKFFVNNDFSNKEFWAGVAVKYKGEPLEEYALAQILAGT